MKRNRVLAALLVFAMALALSGCVSFAGRMAVAARKMEKLKSYSLDMDVDAEVGVSVLGREMPLELALGANGDVNTEPAVSRMNLSLGLFGAKLNMLSYTVRDGEKVTTWISPDGGRSWKERTAKIAQSDSKSGAGLRGIAGLLKLASGFEETGTETVRGSEAVVYAGTVSGKDLQAVLENSGAMESLLAALDLPAESLELESIGGVPFTVAIDKKSGMVTRITADLTELAEVLLPALLDTAASAGADGLGLVDGALSALGFSLKSGRVVAAVELYNFDAAGTIELPETLAAGA